MRVSILVAMTRRGVIGHEGRLPWRQSADLRRFKQLTMGHHIIMGRKTFDSIGRLLPGRTIVILTRNSMYDISGAFVVKSLAKALDAADGDSEVFVVGGGEVYRQALPRAERIYQTIVHVDLPGDTYFPTIDESQWEVVDQQSHQADDRNQYAMTFRVLDRVG